MQKFLKFENKKTDSIINLYKQKSDYKYLNLLPSVSYDIKNNSINAGFSLSSLSNYYQQRHRNKIQLAQLEQRLNEKTENKLNKLLLEIEQFNFYKETLKNSIQLFKTLLSCRF